MDFKIEKNVPMPERGGSKYPLTDMEVGDSFMSDSRTGLAGAIQAQQRKTDWKFKLRTVEGGFRVWRTA